MKFEGIYTPLIAPFNSDFTLNFNAMASAIDFLVDAGVHGIIVAGTIASYPFFRVLLKGKCHKRKKLIAAVYIVLGVFFWLPFIGLEQVNQNLLGFTANDLYSENDSDLQSPLFGKHFEKSTRGGWLAWSALGAPGYALPAQGIGHGIRDLMIQFEQVKNWLDQNEVNNHVLFAGFWGIACTLLLINSKTRGG